MTAHAVNKIWNEDRLHMIIDFEAHAQIKECAYAKAAATGQEPESYTAIYDFDDVRLGIMDKNGIGLQMLSYPGPIHALPPEESARFTVMENNNSYEAEKRRPGRFKGYAMVPVNNVEFALKELKRAGNELGLAGWWVRSSYGNLNIDNDELIPLVYLAAELGMHIYLHPGQPAWERFKGCGPLIESAFGFHVDPALTLLRLITKGVLDKCPDLKIILGHYGEALPFMLDRLDSIPLPAIDADKAINKHPLGYYFEKNIWVTTSGSFSRVAFECTRDRLGIDHMLFGSDFPVEDLTQTVEFLDSMRMTRLEREKLYYRNAGDYFGITSSQNENIL